MTREAIEIMKQWIAEEEARMSSPPPPATPLVLAPTPEDMEEEDDEDIPETEEEKIVESENIARHQFADRLRERGDHQKSVRMFLRVAGLEKGAHARCVKLREETKRRFKGSKGREDAEGNFAAVRKTVYNRLRTKRPLTEKEHELIISFAGWQGLRDIFALLESDIKNGGRQSHMSFSRK